MTFTFMGDGINTLGESEQIALTGVTSETAAEDVLESMGWTKIPLEDVPEVKHWDWGEDCSPVSGWYNKDMLAYGIVLLFP